MSFEVLMLCAVSALVVAIFLGGRGSDAVANDLAHGRSTKESHYSSFNLQALLTLVGLLLVLVATVVGTGSQKQESATDKQVDALAKQARYLHVQLRVVDKRVSQLEKEVAKWHGRH